MAIPAFEFRRKGWHMLSGVLVTPVVVWTSLEYVTVIALGAFLFILVAEVLHLWWGIRLPFWSDQLARTKREHENFSFASLSFLATVVVLLWAAPLPVAFAACAQLALGDGVSALFGRAWGRTRIPYNRPKTLEGSLAGFLAGAVGAFAILAWYYSTIAAAFPVAAIAVVCVAGALAGSVAETLPRLEDNVTVPVASGVAMLLLWWLLGLDPTHGALLERWGFG